ALLRGHDAGKGALGDVPEASGGNDQVDPGEPGALLLGRLLVLEIGVGGAVQESGLQRIGKGGRGGVEPENAHVVGRFDGTGQLPVAGQQRVAGEVPDVVAAIAVVQLAHGKAVFQQGGVDAVGAADVENGRGRDSAGPPVFVDEPAEVRFGQFRDDVVEFAQGA